MPKYQFNESEHIHTLDGKPLMGTTSIINEVYPPPLAWYGSAKALEVFGFISGKKEPDEKKRRDLAYEAGLKIQLMFENELWLDEYMNLLEKAYKNHDTYKKSKGKAGKDIHAQIEAYVLKCLDGGGKPLATVESDKEITDFADWAMKDVDHFIWSEAHCYSEKLFVGGITDFGFVHKNGTTIIGDAKPAVYPKQWLQVAGYGIQMRENGLFEASGALLMTKTVVDGYCIYDYNKGEAHYLGGDWIPKMEAAFIHTVDVYKMKDLTGSITR